MKRKISVMMAVLLMCGSMTACNGTDNGSSAENGGYTRGILAEVDSEAALKELTQQIDKENPEREQPPEPPADGEQPPAPVDGEQPPAPPTDGEQPPANDTGLAKKEDDESVTFDSLTDMQMALNSGRIDYMMCPVIVAEYMSDINEDYHFVVDDLYSEFVMGVLPENASLRDDINKVLEELKVDGTLDRLAQEYINGGSQITSAAPVDGRETLRVVVTGDMPPLDYIAADGTPSGYNVALMQALGDRLNVNIEFVSMAAGQRVTALATGKADVIFWLQSFTMGAAFHMSGFEGAILLTDSYYRCKNASVALDQSVLDSLSSGRPEEPTEPESRNE